MRGYTACYKACLKKTICRCKRYLCSLRCSLLRPQAVLEFRLAYPAEKWRNVYKALTVLEFLLTRGSEAAVAIARDDLLPRLQDLAARFEYYADGRDHGLNVRHRCRRRRSSRMPEPAWSLWLQRRAAA